MAGGGAYPDQQGSSRGQYDHASGPPQYGYQAPPPEYYRPAEPAGELVQVYTQANPNYRLTVREDGAVLAFKNSRDLTQQWIKVDVGPGHGEFIDREGQPGFILVNKATGLPLKHGHQANDFVTTHRQAFGVNSPAEGSIIWTLGRKDEGHGFKGMRAVTNITLNLDAEHADKLHGGVRDGNRLLLSAWKDNENFKWKVEPCEPVA
ncbi:unnamed protein product [Calypogeia fissa]